MDVGIVFAGVVVSILVNTIKEYYKLTPRNTGWVVIALSLAIGGLLVLLKDRGWFDLAFSVYVSAGAVYAFIIKNLEKV